MSTETSCCLWVKARFFSIYHLFLLFRSTTWWSSRTLSWSTCPTLPASTSPNSAPASATATVWTPWRTSSTRICPGSTALQLSSTSLPRGTPRTPVKSDSVSPESSDVYWRWRGWGCIAAECGHNGKALRPFWASPGFCALILRLRTRCRNKNQKRTAQMQIFWNRLWKGWKGR